MILLHGYYELLIGDADADGFWMQIDWIYSDTFCRGKGTRRTTY